MSLTKEQYDALPPIFKEIVNVQKEIDALVVGKCVSISVSHTLKELRKRLDELISACDRVYAPLKTDGPKNLS